MNPSRPLLHKEWDAEGILYFYLPLLYKIGI
jgi:hypothetical protein